MTKEIKIDGMTCGGCVAAVKGTMDELGIKAEVNLEEKKAVLTADNIDMKVVTDKINEIGFKVVS